MIKLIGSNANIGGNSNNSSNFIRITYRFTSVAIGRIPH